MLQGCCWYTVRVSIPSLYLERVAICPEIQRCMVATFGNDPNHRPYESQAGTCRVAMNMVGDCGIEPHPIKERFYRPLSAPAPEASHWCSHEVTILGLWVISSVLYLWAIGTKFGVSGLDRTDFSGFSDQRVHQLHHRHVTDALSMYLSNSQWRSISCFRIYSLRLDSGSFLAAFNLARISFRSFSTTNLIA